MNDSKVGDSNDIDNVVDGEGDNGDDSALVRLSFEESTDESDVREESQCKRYPQRNVEDYSWAH